jgi:hypothetical protein
MPKNNINNEVLIGESDSTAGLGMEEPTALKKFYEFGGEDEKDPLERLRFFCSLAMKGQDWLDVEPFFDDVKGAYDA